MRWVRVAVPLAAIGAFVAQAANAKNVPSFVRQTGLTCNQCHMTWTPTPDMTFTGTKFRLNGYRTPWVAEKIEAGEEGALNGRRLVLGVDGYLSYHMRSGLFTQSKSASNPADAEPQANAVASQPFQSIAWDFTGPIAENVGIWTEWYSTSPTIGIGNSTGFVDNDEYDVRMAFNPGDGGNIVSVFLNNQNQTSPFFGAFGSGAASNQGQFIHFGAAAWLKDRVALQLAIGPGSDNIDYRRLNYGAVLALLPMNTDAMWLMPTVSILAGNDMVPMVSTVQQTTPWPGTQVTRDGLPGVSAYRTGTKAGQPYAAVDQGDATRVLFDVRFGALDRGRWSFNSATGLSFQNETYSDGAKTNLVGFGTSWRVFYERTYGINLQLNRRLNYEFTPAGGAAIDIPDDWGYNVQFSYRQAMNFAWELGFNNTQSLRLAENWRNGWSWVLRWHFLY